MPEAEPSAETWSVSRTSNLFLVGLLLPILAPQTFRFPRHFVIGQAAGGGEGYEARQGLYLAGHYMARDNDVFGTGPGTFNTMYQLYGRHQPDEWLAYMHNDWLETLITFGLALIKKILRPQVA